MKALILFLLFCLTLEYDRLSQYDSKVIYGSGNFYLSLSGFKSGDKVYIEVSYDSFFYETHSIYCRQSNYYSDSEFSYSFTLLTSGTTSTSNNKHTTYYTIKLNGNYNYLLFKFVGSSTWFTIKHAKSSPTWIIIVCISSCYCSDSCNYLLV